MGGSIFDDVMDAAVGAMQSRLSGFASAAGEVVVPWARSLALRVTPIVEQERRRGTHACRIPARTPLGPVQACEERASIRCAACLRPACLGHVFVSAIGEAVCLECVARVVTAVRAAAPPPGPPGPRPPPSAAPSAEEVRAARAFLGLDARATRREALAAYRKLAKKYHPDTAPPEKKAKHAEKFRAITDAWNVLQKAEEAS